MLDAVRVSPPDVGCVKHQDTAIESTISVRLEQRPRHAQITHAACRQSPKATVTSDWPAEAGSLAAAPPAAAALAPAEPEPMPEPTPGACDSVRASTIGATSSSCE